MSSLTESSMEKGEDLRRGSAGRRAGAMSLRPVVLPYQPSSSLIAAESCVAISSCVLALGW